MLSPDVLTAFAYLCSAVAGGVAAVKKWDLISRGLEHFKAQGTLIRERDEARESARKAMETAEAKTQASEGWRDAFDALEQRIAEDLRKRLEFEEESRNNEHRIKSELEGVKQNQSRLWNQLRISLNYCSALITHVFHLQDLLKKEAPNITIPNIPEPPSDLAEAFKEYRIAVNLEDKD